MEFGLEALQSAPWESCSVVLRDRRREQLSLFQTVKVVLSLLVQLSDPVKRAARGEAESNGLLEWMFSKAALRKCRVVFSLGGLEAHLAGPLELSLNLPAALALLLLYEGFWVCWVPCSCL